MPKRTELGGGGFGWKGRELSSACCSLDSCSVTSLVRSVVAGWVGGRLSTWFDCWSVSTLVWTDWVGGGCRYGWARVHRLGREDQFES